MGALEGHSHFHCLEEFKVSKGGDVGLGNPTGGDLRQRVLAFYYIYNKAPLI